MNGVFSVEDFLEPTWQPHDSAEWELDGYLNDPFASQDPPSLHEIRVKSLDEVEGCGSSSSSSFAMEDAAGLTKHPPCEEKASFQASFDSEDEEAYAATGELADPADAKRARRMQSNRESARRSRKRKQEQLNELESQVGQLRDERTSLLNRFTDINRKCDDASVGNRILKADIETLRAKVKMAEEQVKRVTGVNPRMLARGNIGPRFGGGRQNYVVSMAQGASHSFQQPVPKFNAQGDGGGSQM